MPQCDYKTEKNRQCKLEKGHENDPKTKEHKFVLPRKPLTSLLPSGFILKAERVKEGGGIKKTAGRTATKVRDADQRALDKEAVASYQAWVKAGKPAFNDQSKRHLYALNYVVPPNAVDGVLAYLRGCVDTGSLLAGKQFRYTKGMHESGNRVIQAAFMDAPEEKK